MCKDDKLQGNAAALLLLPYPKPEFLLRGEISCVIRMSLWKLSLFARNVSIHRTKFGSLLNQELLVHVLCSTEVYPNYLGKKATLNKELLHPPLLNHFSILLWTWLFCPSIQTKSSLLKIKLISSYFSPSRPEELLSSHFQVSFVSWTTIILSPLGFSLLG